MRRPFSRKGGRESRTGRIVNFLGRVHSRLKVSQQVSGNSFHVINEQLERVVGLDDESVQIGLAVRLRQRSTFQVFLLVLSSDGVEVPEDEVDLVGAATTVRTKHDSVRSRVFELLGLESGVVG